MRIFKTKEFARFARKEKIDDTLLVEAVAQAEAGSVDADLGSGVIKQRVARQGGGKRGGYRVLIFFKIGSRAVFVDGFAKSDRDNIDDDELTAYRKAARLALAFSEQDVDRLVAQGKWSEVEHDDQA